MRFALNFALGGVVAIRYRKFAFWSALSGTLWSPWTCFSAYYLSSALDGYPIAALILSTCTGAVLIGGVAWVQSKLRPEKATA